VPAGSQVEGNLSCRLWKSRDLSIAEAAERLLEVAQTAGFDAETLLWMLDHGMTVDELLQLIDSKLQCSQSAA